MKAAELRVGNYVSTMYPKFNYEKVTEIKEKVVYTCNIKGIGYISLKPIPLTEEILLKCGFEKYGKYHDSYKKNTYIIELGILGDKYCFRKRIDENNSLLLQEFKHLHQLQNLYYCLTGKELNIEL